MSYFQPDTIDYLYSQVDNPFSETVSLCHHCHKHVPALRYFNDSKVYMAKYCTEHGVMHHLIESDSEFYNNLNCTYDPNLRPGFYNGVMLTEVTDRCNLDCPHCYHIPNNALTDINKEIVLNNLKLCKEKLSGLETITLAGAEATIRRDFPELISDITNLGLDCSVISNGIKLADEKFLKKCLDAGLKDFSVGLNHPSYNNIPKARKKQEIALDNSLEYGLKIGYISYTMASLTELDDILKEIIDTNWNPAIFRIRYGSDIGTNPGQERLFLSDLYKEFSKWCKLNGKNFEIIEPCDNNIYHIMVNLEGRKIRLIQWCDETDIDMEELKTGPWCDFVYDGITNFLHQIIRRDVYKNQKIALPDTPPLRYHYRYMPCTEPLDLRNLK